MTSSVSNADLELFTDAAGARGSGVYFEGMECGMVAGEMDFGGLGKKPGIVGTVSDCAGG